MARRTKGEEIVRECDKYFFLKSVPDNEVNRDIFYGGVRALHTVIERRKKYEKRKLREKNAK